MESRAGLESILVAFEQEEGSTLDISPAHLEEPVTSYACLWAV